jgi:hypothetical protein
MPGMVGLRQQKIRQLFVALGEALRQQRR